MQVGACVNDPSAFSRIANYQGVHGAAKAVQVFLRAPSVF